MKFKFKSTEADLKFNLQSQLLLMNKNILYITRQVDLCVKWLKTFQVDDALQKQIPDYPLDDMAKDIPEVDKDGNPTYS